MVELFLCWSKDCLPKNVLLFKTRTKSLTMNHEFKKRWKKIQILWNQILKFQDLLFYWHKVIMLMIKSGLVCGNLLHRRRWKVFGEILTHDSQWHKILYKSSWWQTPRKRCWRWLSMLYSTTFSLTFTLYCKVAVCKLSPVVNNKIPFEQLEVRAFSPRKKNK